MDTVRNANGRMKCLNQREQPSSLWGRRTRRRMSVSVSRPISNASDASYVNMQRILLICRQGALDEVSWRAHRRLHSGGLFGALLEDVHKYFSL